jgi:hypothetical protein
MEVLTMKKPTQEEKVLNWLRTQGDLPVIDGGYLLRIGDVRKCVERLRKKGYKILTINIKNAYGGNFNAYRLIKE